MNPGGAPSPAGLVLVMLSGIAWSEWWPSSDKNIKTLCLSHCRGGNMYLEVPFLAPEFAYVGTYSWLNSQLCKVFCNFFVTRL